MAGISKSRAKSPAASPRARSKSPASPRARAAYKTAAPSLPVTTLKTTYSRHFYSPGSSLFEQSLDVYTPVGGALKELPTVILVVGSGW